MGRKKFRRARRKPRPNANNKPILEMKTMDGDTDDISIEGGKAEQKTQHQQNIEKVQSTLQDHISGHVTHGIKPGPWPYLTAKEEKSLTAHLIDAAKFECGKTRKKVNRMAENFAREKGTLRNKNIFNGWWIERQSQLSLRQTDDAISQESISWYFDLLESRLKEHQLEDCPGQIYNMDETGMPLNPRPLNIIAKSEVNYRQSGKKEQITVIGCGNAIGQSIPPMVIFEGKYLNYEWWSTWNYLWYEWAGMDWPKAFSFWLKHFLNYANPGRPCYCSWMGTHPTLN